MDRPADGVAVYARRVVFIENRRMPAAIGRSAKIRHFRQLHRMLCSDVAWFLPPLEELSVFCGVALLCGEIHQLRVARIGLVVRFGLVSNSPYYSH
jgi:hypothetical protein